MRLYFADGTGKRGVPQDGSWFTLYADALAAAFVAYLAAEAAWRRGTPVAEAEPVVWAVEVEVEGAEMVNDGRDGEPEGITFRTHEGDIMGEPYIVLDAAAVQRHVAAENLRATMV